MCAILTVMLMFISRYDISLILQRICLCWLTFTFRINISIYRVHLYMSYYIRMYYIYFIQSNHRQDLFVSRTCPTGGGGGGVL